jgi:hypothetical protein
MRNQKTNDCYELRKREIKALYVKIGPLWCPALDTHINFNRSGFRHLIWKKSDQRTKAEQQRRFAMLPFAEKIIKASNVFIAYKERGPTRFWALTEESNDKQIRLIIRQISNGQKHFFSIFEVKQKSTQ